MILSSINSCFWNTQNSIQSLIFRCSGACVRRRQVHPEILTPEDLEFVTLGSQRVIRVLHLPPQHSTQTVVAANESSFNALNDEVRKILDVPSEDYWFTRSNRPFKAGDVCDCTSGTLVSQEGIPMAWKDVTNGFSVEVKVSSGNTRSNESNVSGACNVYGKFAENFVRVVLKEAYDTAVNRRKCNSSTSECQNLIPAKELDNVWYRDSASKISANCNEENLSQVVTIAQVHHGDVSVIVEDNINEKDGYHFNSDVEALTRSPKDGIINLSFSGTFSEPDHLASPFIREDQLMHLSESKLEVSSADERSKFSICGAYLSSEANKNLGNSNSIDLVTDGINKSDELRDFFDQRFSKDTRNDSVPKDDSANVFNSKIVECSTGSIDPNKFSDYVDEVIERKADVDCCWHSKIIQKPSLLFLHGAGSSADIWSLQLQYFSSVGYEVFAPDMLGHGYSSAPDCPSAYAFDRLLQDVLQIFDKFILQDQKCVIIGHSYGSCFAAAVARYRPQQVVQLVLLSSGGPSPLVPSKSVFSFPSCIMSLMKPFLMCGFKRDLFYGPRGKNLHPCCTYELPPYVLKHVERGQEWVEGDAAFHRRIMVPTLLVHGLKDPYISLVEECEMERTIPRSFLEVISNAGHMVMLDTPEQLCHMIHSFIAWWNS